MRPFTSVALQKKEVVSLHFSSYLAPPAGFEPATNRLTGDCSTAELHRNIVLKERGNTIKIVKYRKMAGVIVIDLCHDKIFV